MLENPPSRRNPPDVSRCLRWWAAAALALVLSAGCSRSPSVGVDGSVTAGPATPTVQQAQQAVAKGADLSDVRDMFETNVFGVARMVQAVAPQMRDPGWPKYIQS